MFRSLAFIAMRQKQEQTRHAKPFPLAAGKELIDDHLRAVGEIAELRFPKHESIRFGKAIAIFEPQHGFF